MKRVLALLVCGGMMLAAGAGASWGQTTQPAPAPEQTPWQMTVRQVGDALAKGDKAGLSALLGDKPSLHVFNSPANPNVDDLLALVKSADKIIGCRGYQGKPQTMATDLAADFKENVHDVSEEVRRRFVPDEAAAMAKANAAAVQWFEVNFDIKTSEWNAVPVGVVELWVPSGDKHKLAFVLLRGQEESEGRFRIVAAVWGDPLREKK